MFWVVLTIFAILSLCGVGYLVHRRILQIKMDKQQADVSDRIDKQVIPQLRVIEECVKDLDYEKFPQEVGTLNKTLKELQEFCADKNFKRVQAFKCKLGLLHSYSNGFINTYNQEKRQDPRLLRAYLKNIQSQTDSLMYCGVGFDQAFMS